MKWFDTQASVLPTLYLDDPPFTPNDWDDCKQRVKWIWSCVRWRTHYIGNFGGDYEMLSKEIHITCERHRWGQDNDRFPGVFGFEQYRAWRILKLVSAWYAREFGETWKPLLDEISYLEKTLGDSIYDKKKK